MIAYFWTNLNLSLLILVLIGKPRKIDLRKGSDSCEGRCWENYNPNNECHCNAECSAHKNCCDDFQTFCTLTCQNRCGNGFDGNYECQCNEACDRYDFT